jgi:hypothetical protein
MDDPMGQLSSVLDTVAEYIPLIEKNCRSVTEGHTWRIRWQTIASMLLL